MASLLDIVTVALFIVPLTVEVFDGLGIDPLPFVIAEVLAANIGGISTMVGDPTKVIIGTGLMPNLTFNRFLTNTGPIALAIRGVNTPILYLRNHGFLHRDALRRHKQRGPLNLPTPASAVKKRLLRVSIISLGLAVGF